MLTAYYNLRATNTIATTAIVRSADCEVRLGAEFPDDGGDYCDDKEAFANMVRCAAVAHQASSVTLISEAWQAPTGWAARPSLAPDRIEVLLVVVETREGATHSTWELERRWDGSFLKLGKVTHSSFVPRDKLVDGTFAGLLPPFDVMNDPDAQLLAREILDVQGFHGATGNAGSVH
jgi:hypothetical protein